MWQSRSPRAKTPNLDACGSNRSGLDYRMIRRNRARGDRPAPTLHWASTGVGSNSLQSLAQPHLSTRNKLAQLRTWLSWSSRDRFDRQGGRTRRASRPRAHSQRRADSFRAAKAPGRQPRQGVSAKRPHPRPDRQSCHAPHLMGSLRSLSQTETSSIGRSRTTIYAPIGDCRRNGALPVRALQ